MQGPGEEPSEQAAFLEDGGGGGKGKNDVFRRMGVNRTWSIFRP